MDIGPSDPAHEVFDGLGFDRYGGRLLECASGAAEFLGPVSVSEQAVMPYAHEPAG